MDTKKLSLYVIDYKIETSNCHVQGQIHVKNVTFSTKCNNFNIKIWLYEMKYNTRFVYGIQEPNLLLKYQIKVKTAQGYEIVHNVT